MSVRTCSFRPLAGVNYNPREEPEAREAAHAGFRPLAGVNYNPCTSVTPHPPLPSFRPLAGVNYNYNMLNLFVVGSECFRPLAGVNYNGVERRCSQNEEAPVSVPLRG